MAITEGVKPVLTQNSGQIEIIDECMVEGNFGQMNRQSGTIHYIRAKQDDFLPYGLYSLLYVCSFLNVFDYIYNHLILSVVTITGKLSKLYTCSFISLNELGMFHLSVIISCMVTVLKQGGTSISTCVHMCITKKRCKGLNSHLFTDFLSKGPIFDNVRHPIIIGHQLKRSIEESGPDCHVKIQHS